MVPEHPLTVSQACHVLGISERTLRRILRQPQVQAQILAQYRHTATGLRRSSLLPPELIRSLQEAKKADNGGENQIPANTSILSDNSVLAYERLLAEQAARINDLQQALLLERERLRQVTNSLAEAQQVLANQSRPFKRDGAARIHLSLWQRLFGRW